MALELDTFKYEVAVVPVKADGQAVEVRAECGDITFINLSAVTCYIGVFPLLAGASFTFSANRYEYNTTVYQVRVGVVSTDNLTIYVLRKVYTGKKIIVQ